MRALHLTAIAIAALGFLATLALLILTTAGGPPTPAPPPPTAPDQGLENLKFPEFALTDHNDQPATHAILEGHYTIIDFVFTHCPLACPAMTGRMAELQDTLKDTGVRFASFSLDPANDTPPVLREYASNFGADLSTWTFLTGDRAAIHAMLTDSLGFELRDDPTVLVQLGEGRTMPNIIHPVRFFLVGPDRQVLGMYSSEQLDQMALLAERAKLLTSR